MYEVIAQQLAEEGSQKRYINERSVCRYCGAVDAKAFGKRDNAHCFPVALGNRVLYTLDECKACNSRFSIYEDALLKAVGPFLTLGGVKGRNGVRQTGRSAGKSKIRHSKNQDGRSIRIVSEGDLSDALSIDPSSGIITSRIPIEGDPFVPRYAYKALLKIALSILPKDQLSKFTKAIASLQSRDDAPHDGPLVVGFSHAFVGNAPPALAGQLLRRKDDDAAVPYMIFVFMAGSVCFQIWVSSDEADRHVPKAGSLGIEFSAQLPKPEGGYLSICFGEPIQFDWISMEPVLQPFKAFELQFNPKTTEGNFTPIPR